MGEQIEFPKNFNVYMTQVMTHLREGNVVKAIDFMKKAYAIKAEDTLNVLLVSSLLQVGEYEEALALADEKDDFYQTDEKRLLIYVEVLLENHQILQAEKHIKAQLENKAVKYADSWERLDSRLTEVKRAQEEKRRKEEEQTVRELYSLASLNTLEQFSKMKAVYSLSNDRLKQLAPHLLVNPYVHPLVRATLFSLLAERGIEGTYPYLWFDEIKEGSPRDTFSLEEDPTAKRTSDALEDYLSKDPSLYQLAKNELDTLLLMLYPYVDDVIEQGEEKSWVMTVIQTFDPAFNEENSMDKEKTSHITGWIEKIHSELLRFE